jgi:hypothetical protein
MGIFIPGKRLAPRRFNYEPRYYDPKKDEDLRRRLRIQSKTRRPKTPNALFLVILLILSLYVFWVLH